VAFSVRSDHSPMLIDTGHRRDRQDWAGAVRAGPSCRRTRDLSSPALMAQRCLS
jgi:hypothetical protein